ncbi:hypothetical protein DACRYDRAFT_52252, partial [Dacryopinax primogenitus]
FDMLNADNWYPWKRCMQALLREQNLLSHVDSSRMREWDEIDMRAQNQIELCVGYIEMVYLIGALTVGQMWSQLIMVKELRGELGAMAIQH